MIRLRNPAPRPLPASLALAAAGLAAWGVIEDAGTARAPVTGYDPLAPAGLTVKFSRERLEVRGHTASADHERALRQLLAQRFSGIELVLDLKPQVLPPEHWNRSSLAVIDAVAVTHSASAQLAPREISINGVTTDARAFAVRLAGVRAGLPDDVRLRSDVVAVDAVTVTQACRELVETVAKHQVRFEQSSDVIRTASFANLDRLADAARNCTSLDLKIGGHTDSTGDPEWNLYLSKARAQAVADYLARHGIAADRLFVAGHGADRPVADNETAYGRSLNRRIEIDVAERRPNAAAEYRSDNNRSENNLADDYRPGSSAPSGLSSPNNSTSNTKLAPGGIAPRPRSP